MRANLEHLQRTLALSQALHAAAKAGDWERMASLETARRPIIEKAFQGGQAIEDALGGRLITEILELDRQAMALAGTARDAVAEELGKLSRGKRVVNAYRAVAT